MRASKPMGIGIMKAAACTSAAPHSHRTKKTAAQTYTFTNFCRYIHYRRRSLDSFLSKRDTRTGPVMKREEYIK
jgi:hypothetical protein